MPLRDGYGQATVHQNIGEMVAGGKHSIKSATKAALDHARECYFKRYPQGYLPAYLKLPNGKRTRKAWEGDKHAR